jgi:nicotinamide-nucleotide amidase
MSPPRAPNPRSGSNLKSLISVYLSSTMPSAEIIAIGSELLTPQKTDTNSLWLTERLNELGVEVKLKTVVGDDPLRLQEAIRDALSRSEIVITTGGLGPTEDDITRAVAAESVERKLIHSPELEEEIRGKFIRMKREMPERNRRQAYLIEGGDPLPNTFGTAPGMILELNGRFLVVLPGPPKELKPMFTEHVIPRISYVTDGTVIRRRVLKVSGMGESAIDEAIAERYKEYSHIDTSILFNKSEVEIHLTAKGRTAEECESMNSDLISEIKEILGIALFSEEGEEMEEVVAKLLTAKGETVAVAESCTGGLVAMRLTEVPGSSAFFNEGVIAYANHAKVKYLGVEELLLEEYGAVSAEVAEAMAKGMLLRSGAHHAISVTGIAGPSGGSEEKPVGTVFIGYASKETSRTVSMRIPGDRFLIRWRSSQAALDLLRRQIIRSRDADYRMSSP